MATLRKSKNKQKEKVNTEADTQNDDNKPVIKSKKEKEREKKEKEKQRKKLLAEKKKAAQKASQKPAPAKADSKESSPAPEDEKPTATAAAASTAKGKKGKKIPAGLAALKKQMELKKKAEEEAEKAAEEERKKAEEEERLIAEEAKKKEEARLRKKEKEKQKREELKAQGKLLTKKQKEQLKLAERRREQLLASGNIIVEGLTADNKKKKPVYGKKKSKKDHNKHSSNEATPEPESKPPKIEKKIEDEEEEQEDWEKGVSEDDEEDAILDDWEAALDSDGEVKDWEEEEAEKKQKEEQRKAQKKAEEKAKLEAEAKALKIAKEKEIADREAKAKAELEAKAKAKEEEDAIIQAALMRKKHKPPVGQNESNLRSPICCILGHVDTGKTKLLDKIRQTNVQEGEAGGITQQIGATYFPIEAIKQKTAVMQNYEESIFNVPGLLIIDTPGHESFTNLRSRGSSLCNIAILVIDLMHGLEQQTLESIRLLRDRKTPFVVALNKIDRLYSWETFPNNSFRDSFAKQKKSVQREFEDRLGKIKVALAEQGLNSELYFQNKNMSKFVSIIPTSAVTGEGVPDLLWLLLELTQKRMSKQLMYLSGIEATILEVKVIEGLGTTIDVILSNGVLKEGDRIVLCGLNGPIVTNIRALLTPQPLRELRIKSAYVHNKEVKAALGVKISANDLEKAVAGSRLLVVGPDDDEEDLMEEVMEDLSTLLDSVDTSGRGVTVQASTLGSLEALLDFLKSMKIPVMSIGIGPVYKRDVMKATTMLDKAKEYAVMLCFDVKIDKEAEQYATEHGITIFNADIIYHLFDEFTAYQNKLLEEKRKENLHFAIFPCVLKTLQMINNRNPMIIGIEILEGSLRIGTPIGFVRPDPVTNEKVVHKLGVVQSLQINHQPFDVIKKGQTNQGVSMRLDTSSGQQLVWGRHFDESDTLYSVITRRSIDTLKDAAFRDSVPRDDWLLIKQLKQVLNIS